MSKENVEAFKRGLDAYNRRDVDAMLEHWTPDVVLDWSNARNFDAGVFQGHDEVRAFTKLWQARSAWLITMRDHKVASFTLYQTKQEALEAAGLSE